jgi:hypothetical protein
MSEVRRLDVGQSREQAKPEGAGFQMSESRV